MVDSQRPQSSDTAWRTRARDVTGHAIDAGHFLAEERPRETLTALQDFLGDAPGLP